MKKQRLLAVLLMTALCTPVVISCGDDDTKPDGGNGGVPTNAVLTTTEQKEFLEDVGLELNGKFKAEDFRHYTDLANYIDEAYDDYEWDDVEDWARDIWETLRGKSVGTSTEKEEESWGNTTYTYYYNYTDYKALLLASNFTGRWEARNGRWHHKDADDLSFVCKNQSGQECTLRLTTSGKVTKVHLYDDEDWKDYDYTMYVTNEYIDRTECTIGVPQHITLTLTEGGATLCETKVDIDLSSVSNEEFDLSRSAFNASSSSTLSNGYVVKGENLAYSSKSATGSATLIKSGETLVTATTFTDLSGIPRELLTNLYDMDDDDIDKLFDKSTGNVAFNLDVLGKVQLKGSINDVRQLVNDCEAADDDYENESRFKQDVENINNRIKAHIYYNGGTKEQADFLFIPFEDRWDRYVEWYMEPGIKFPDGSSYTLEKFFNEDDFKDLIDAVERLGDDFERLGD